MPQPGLNGRMFDVLIGNTLGGSSAINGMMFQRGTAQEYDIWGLLAGRNSTWNWNGLLPYFIRVSSAVSFGVLLQRGSDICQGVHFTPPDSVWAKDYNITWDPKVWGQAPATHIYATFATATSGLMSELMLFPVSHDLF